MTVCLAASNAGATTCWGWTEVKPFVGLYVDAPTYSAMHANGKLDTLTQVPAVELGTAVWWRREVLDCPHQSRATYLAPAGIISRLQYWGALRAERLAVVLVALILVILTSLALRRREYPSWRRAALAGIGVLGIGAGLALDLGVLLGGEKGGLGRVDAERLAKSVREEEELVAQQNAERASTERNLAQEAATKERHEKLTREKCAETEACRSHGACGYHEWRSGWDCRAKTQVHCEQSESCRVYGNCRLTPGGGGGCRASTADCLASERCQTIGACVLVDNRCAVTRTSCERWAACPEPGACVRKDDRCEFSGCEDTKACADEGRCVEQDGTCVATEQSCKTWKSCPAPGECILENETCAITERACQRSLGCKEVGSCRLIDGVCQPGSKDDCRSAIRCRARPCQLRTYQGQNICSPFDPNDLKTKIREAGLKARNQ